MSMKIPLHVSDTRFASPAIEVGAHEFQPFAAPFGYIVGTHMDLSPKFPYEFRQRIHMRVLRWNCQRRPSVSDPILLFPPPSFARLLSQRAAALLLLSVSDPSSFNSQLSELHIFIKPITLHYTPSSLSLSFRLFCKPQPDGRSSKAIPAIPPPRSCASSPTGPIHTSGATCRLLTSAPCGPSSGCGSCCRRRIVSGCRSPMLTCT